MCCALPYGTGNDFSRVTGWGGTPDDKYYKSLKSLMNEICLNSELIDFNVWDIEISFHKGGDIF